MVKNFKFYKEDNRWYINLPEWEGSKAELEMVMGADTMLSYMSEDQDNIMIHFDTKPYKGSDVLQLKDILPEGAFYTLERYRGIELNLDMWLCDVTKFVFGDFPENIYFNAKINIF